MRMRTRNIELRMRRNLKRTSSKVADLWQGAGFRSCDDFEAAVAKYCEANHVVMVVRDSKTVEKAATKAKSAYPAGFSHVYVQYVCKHFGAQRKSESKGIRRQQS